MESTVRQRQYLTLAETARRLKVPQRTIRRRIEDGSIPAVRLGSTPSSPLRIPEDGLDAWLYEESELAPKSCPSRKKLARARRGPRCSHAMASAAWDAVRPKGSRFTTLFRCRKAERSTTSTTWRRSARPASPSRREARRVLNAALLMNRDSRSDEVSGQSRTSGAFPGARR